MSMTVEEAGRRGGQRTLEKHGKEFLSEIGKKGAAALSTKGNNYFSDIGKIGGAAVRDKYGRERYAQIGARGGETNRKKGKEYFQMMARKSAEARRARRAVQSANLTKTS